ncbi:hypothetical protein ACFL5C_03395, partial [Candidatus Omnitrophota bacterium]
LGGIPKFVEQARLQSFVMMEPYLAGLDAGSIIRLRDTSLKEAFEKIRDGLPVARPLDADNILKPLFEAYGRPGVTATPLPEGLTPDNEEVWVSANVRALKEYRDTRSDKAAGELLALQARLSKVMRAMSPREKGKLAARHEGVAMALAQADEVMDIWKTFRDKGVIKTQAPRVIGIDARADSGFRLEPMVPVLLDLAGKDPNLHICVITDRKGRLLEAIPPDKIPKNIVEMPETEMPDLEEDEGLAGQVKDYLDPKIPLSAVSIVTGEMMKNELMKDKIVSHVGNMREKSANFVIVSKGMVVPLDPADNEFTNRMNSLLPVVAATSLLKRALDEKERPSVAVMSENASTIAAAMKEALPRLLEFVIEITRLDVGARIREEITAIIKIKEAL